MKRTARKVFAAAGILAAIAAAAFFLLISGLDRIAASAIETFGSEATGTEVKVSSVRFRPAAGEGSIRDLRIANPEGFSGRDAIRLGNITMTVSPGAVFGDVVVIDKVLVRDSRVLYEINRSGDSNIGRIRKNLEESRRAGARKEAAEGSGKKLIIRSLVIEDGRILVQVGSPAEKPFSAALPRIALKNLGGRGGAPPAAVARQVACALAYEAAVAAPAANFGKSLDETFRSLIGK